MIARTHNEGKALGIILSVLGAVMLWDAYERRGRSRPFASKFLPGG